MILKPLYPFSSRFVLTIIVIKSVRAPCVIQVLFPVILYTLPSLTALVFRLPRSDPVFGSLKTAVGRISPEEIFGNHFFFCSSVPPSRINSAAISDLVPIDPIPIYPRLNSSVTTHIAIFFIPRPP